MTFPGSFMVRLSINIDMELIALIYTSMYDILSFKIAAWAVVKTMLSEAATKRVKWVINSLVDK